MVLGDITQKGYEKKRAKLLAPYVPQTQGRYLFGWREAWGVSGCGRQLGEDLLFTGTELLPEECKTGAKAQSALTDRQPRIRRGGIAAVTAAHVRQLLQDREGALSATVLWYL